MNKPNKSKRIIREIGPKMKIIESDNEEKELKKEEGISEESLEDITMDAPSAREFPEFIRRQEEQEIVQTPSETITPSATTEAENKNAVRYQVQREVSEAEIARTYRTEISEAKPIPTMLSTSEQERTRGRFENRELESLRTRDEEKRYEISLEPEQPVKKRKYPWEA